MAHRCAVLAMSAITIAALMGCDDGKPKRVPVSGQVLIDGKPLTHGSIRFIPTGHRASFGKIDEQGHFSLSCFGQNDGAVTGEHKVEVTAMEKVSPTLIRWHAPKKYQDQATSNLTERIEGPVDNLEIKLSWDGGKPFDEAFVAPH